MIQIAKAVTNRGVKAAKAVGGFKMANAQCAAQEHIQMELCRANLARANNFQTTQQAVVPIAQQNTGQDAKPVQI